MLQSTLYRISKNGYVSYINGTVLKQNTLSREAFKANNCSNLLIMENGRFYQGSSEKLIFDTSADSQKHVVWLGLLDGHCRHEAEGVFDHWLYSTLRNPITQHMVLLESIMDSITNINDKRQSLIQIGNLEYNRKQYDQLYGSIYINKFNHLTTTMREDIWMPRILTYIETNNAFICCRINHMARILHILSMQGYYVSPVYETESVQ